VGGVEEGWGNVRGCGVRVVGDRMWGEGRVWGGVGGVEGGGDERGEESGFGEREGDVEEKGGPI